MVTAPRGLPEKVPRKSTVGLDRWRESAVEALVTGKTHTGEQAPKAGKAKGVGVMTGISGTPPYEANLRRKWSFQIG